MSGVVSYRFCHAFFSQTLYEETSAPRRIRLHQQVARALEDVFARRLEEHASELADHFSHSSDTADLVKAVYYGELAASRATGVFDYGEASRLLERAIDVQEVLDHYDHERLADLYLALGDALQPAGEPQRAVEYAAEKAWALIETSHDRVRAFRAFQLAIMALIKAGSIAQAVTPIYQRWLTRISSYEPVTPGEQVAVNFARGSPPTTVTGLSFAICSSGPWMLRG